MHFIIQRVLLVFPLNMERFQFIRGGIQVVRRLTRGHLVPLSIAKAVAYNEPRRVRHPLSQEAQSALLNHTLVAVV